MMDSDEDAAGIIKGGTVSRAEDTEPEKQLSVLAAPCFSSGSAL